VALAVAGPTGDCCSRGRASSSRSSSSRSGSSSNQRATGLAQRAAAAHGRV
jgi:hypothetical protein